MRIPTIENDLYQSRLSNLDPKLVLLLEKLAQQPLLISKLQLHTEQGLTLNLKGFEGINQVQLPLASSSYFNQVTQVSSGQDFQLQLGLTNRFPLAGASTNVGTNTSTKASPLISLQLLPLAATQNSARNSSQINAINQEISPLLTFAKAQLLGNGHLRLTQPINQPSNISSNREVTKTQAENNVSNPKPTANTSTGPLKIAIEQLLENRSRLSLQTSPHLEKLLSQTSRLVESLNKAAPRESINKMPENLRALVKLPLLNTKTISELIQNVNYFSKTTPIQKSLDSLLSAVTKLQSAIEFSSANRQLQIKKRLASSGQFMEANLTPNRDIRLASQHSPNSPPLAQQLVNSQQSGGDLKLLSMQISQSIQDLLSNLSQPKSEPLITARLLQQLATSPALQQRLSAPGGQSNLPGSVTNQAPNSEQIMSEARQVFATRLLQEFAWPLFIKAPFKKLDFLNEKALLLNQKKLLTDMAVEVKSLLQKTETRQLLNLNNQLSPVPQVLFDLPIYRGGQIDSFELLLASDETPAKDPSQKSWTVTIRFELEPLAPLLARVKWKDERISTQFFSEDPTTAQLLNQHLDQLKNSLFSAGVDIDQLASQTGKVSDELRPENEKKVDIRA